MKYGKSHLSLVRDRNVLSCWQAGSSRLSFIFLLASTCLPWRRNESFCSLTIKGMKKNVNTICINEREKQVSEYLLEMLLSVRVGGRPNNDWLTAQSQQTYNCTSTVFEVEVTTLTICTIWVLACLLVIHPAVETFKRGLSNRRLSCVYVSDCCQQKKCHEKKSSIGTGRLFSAIGGSSSGCLQRSDTFIHTFDIYIHFNFNSSLN